jgi:hypothetical protein
MTGVVPPVLVMRPAVPLTEVTVPLPLLLKVVQSVLVKYPLTDVVAAGIEIAGVAPPDDTTGAVPVTPVTVPEPLLLKVVQSAALNAPRLAADAVGTFSVITGVVVEFATVELRSVPEVPKVSAATEVTVPPATAEATVAVVIRPCASIVTTGICVDDPYVPALTAVFAIEMVGDAPTPVPFATNICPEVPNICVNETLPALDSVRMPFPDAFARFNTCPVRLIVGFAACPLPSAMAIPEPLTAMFLGVTVLEPVFTAKPVPAVFKEAVAPCKDSFKVDCAPPSVIPMPKLLEIALLLGRVVS